MVAAFKNLVRRYALHALRSELGKPYDEVADITELRALLRASARRRNKRLLFTILIASALFLAVMTILIVLGLQGSV